MEYILKANSGMRDSPIKLRIQLSTVDNTMFGNVHNLRSSLSHEKIHILQAVRIIHAGGVELPKDEGQRNKTLSEMKNSSELEAINFQESLPSYKNTTSGYKEAVKAYKARFE